MHELPYEPPREGAGDSRRLARWAAAWTLAVFGLMGAANLVTMVLNVTAFGIDIVLSELAAGGYAIGTTISALSLPLVVVAFVVWLATGRVVVLLLASVPLAIASGQVFYYVRVSVTYGLEWPMLPWLSVNVGYLVLAPLFLTRTFRRAVNAPRTARA